MSYRPTTYQDRRKRERRVWGTVWLLALIINLGFFAAFMLCDGLRYSLFKAEDQIELSEEQLRARKEMLRERLQRERKKFQLSEEDEAMLKEESIQAQIDSIHEYIRSLIAMKKRAELIKTEGLARVEKRTIENYRSRLFEPLEFGVNHLLDTMRGYEPIVDKKSLSDEQKAAIDQRLAETRKHAELLEIATEKLKADHVNDELIDQFDRQLLTSYITLRDTIWHTEEQVALRSDLRDFSALDFYQLGDHVTNYRDKHSIDLAELNDVSVAVQRFQDAPETADFEKRSIGNIYRLAVALEMYCADAMRDARASHLCIIDNISFNAALAKLASMEKERPDLADALDDAARNMADLAEWQRLLALARAEMMDMANATEANASASTMMGLGGLIPVSSSGGGIGNMFSNFSSSSPNMMFLPNMDIVGVMRQASNASGLGALDNRYRAGGGGKEMQQLVKSMEQMRLNEALVRKNAAPGRIFSKDADTKGFLYVDTWYAIGPWENDGRVDYSRKHPPDWEINFDRTYVDGKQDENGVARELAWQFIQSSTIRVTVPDEVDDGTYYLYTELFFEDDMEMFMVIASDDAASVRVTNPQGTQLEIWRDSEKSSWSMDEGAKKVFFSKGYHKVLVRLENGPTYASCSMLLFPTQQSGS